jgi:Leucine-rich repeat (LRR) protein
MKYIKSFENISKGINNTITTMDFSGIKMNELPELPDTLLTLYCNNCGLKKLPELPKNLKHLKCSNNNLTELPELPESITELRCYGNKLSYSNLKEYLEWIDKKYPERKASNKYNI